MSVCSIDKWMICMLMISHGLWVNYTNHCLLHPKESEGFLGYLSTLLDPIPSGRCPTCVHNTSSRFYPTQPNQISTVCLTQEQSHQEFKDLALLGL